MSEEQSPESNTQERPRMLKILCILTFVWSGYQILANLVMAVFYEEFIFAIKTVGESFKLPGLDLILQTPPLFFGVSSMIYAGSVAGAILMWNLKKSGFHIYTIAQILLVLAPMYFLKLPGPNFFDIIVSGLFIFLYSTNLKNMS